jgi:hypothetical protein
MDLVNHKISTEGYSPKQFIVFRAILGIYLFFHFIFLFPYSAEMFSDQGIFGQPELNFTYGFFPDLLNYFDSVLFVKTFIAALALLSLLFIFGIQRRLVAILLWYGWACLINRNNMIINPGMPYIGWLLLACAVIPSGENDRINKKGNNWTLPNWCLSGAWLIMALGYTLSGFDKLQSPSWVNGSTFSILLENPLSRNTILREVSLTIPPVILQLITWGVLMSELLFLPLALFSKTRKYAWMLLVTMHLSILCYINFSDLTTGMLMIHLFTFDMEWIVGFFKKRAGKAELIQQ